jgi:hypothetical protein
VSDMQTAQAVVLVDRRPTRQIAFAGARELRNPSHRPTLRGRKIASVSALFCMCVFGLIVMF